jgi:hypothetical protein
MPINIEAWSFQSGFGLTDDDEEPFMAFER